MKPERTLSCEEVRADLPLFVGGELHQDGEQGSAVRALEAHLAECPKCSAELDSLRRSRQALQGLSSKASAPGLWPDVREALLAEGRIQGSPVRFAPARRMRRLAAAALLAGLGLFLWAQGPDAPLTTAEAPGPVELVMEIEEAPLEPSLASPLRPLSPDEVAFSESAEAVEGAGTVTLPTGPLREGPASLAGNRTIR
ncbi:MAG: zf-HC2 domain-containing protein [Planctomycetes bacterium]|nr:zf-HC2 domain-containing protein [Planctomycetota bacterium]